MCFEYHANTKIIQAESRNWCIDHFRCIGCHKNLAVEGKKYLEWDGKLMCNKCYQQLPSDVRRRLIKYSDIDDKVKEKLKREKSMQEIQDAIPPQSLLQ